ncbi:hypothetical protein [Anaeromicropila herbilytica]|uniref:Uncharacterized protein n=1 Tax=Anaeromicropila herbilytica TaxID=2785025 RepID=A0A7R7EP31_9FIRM|nr:hypothetical protein [Anaeromicropila herbilytica]BCN32445.1 hypothetical protein bsdtb5_37400 [Anaeromicropila herbilytica]
MEDNKEETAYVVGEYIENISGIIKMVENRSNPWKVMIRSPKKWVLDRPVFNESHPDIQEEKKVKRPSIVLKKQISESFDVQEDAYSVQCNIFYRSSQAISFNALGTASIPYEVVLSYENEEKESRKLTKKGEVALMNESQRNQAFQAKVTFDNHSIHRDGNDDIVVTALIIIEL